jgi:hypothetical protein
MNLGGGLESFIVRPSQDAPDGVLERLAEQVNLMGGLVLMATGSGSLVVALPRGGKERLSADPHVALVGGVTLQPDGRAARALQERFAMNAARQLVSQGRLGPAGGAPPGTQTQLGRSPVVPLQEGALRERRP